MKDKLTYGLIKFFSLMPFFILYRISDLIAFILNYVIGYRKDIIENNLRNSFPDKTDKEIKQIRIQFNRNFADQMMETLKMFTISGKSLAKRLVYENPELITKWIKEERSVMLGAGHFGNWEYPAGFPFTIPGFESYNVVYAPIKNKFLNQKILDTRERFGCHLMPMRNTFREIISHPDKGQVYGFLFDQSPHKSKVKYDLEFLNQTTPVHLGTEQVARLKNAVVMYLEIRRVKRGYYKATPVLISENPNDLEEYEITHRLFEMLEETIKSDPAQWLWSHRRWKYKPGRHYKLKS